MTTLKKNDLKNIEARGITLEEIEYQIQNFITGFPYVQLVKPAVPGDGITVLSTEDVHTYVSLYERQAARYSVVKFVPASGAASRMFKELFSFLEKYSGSEQENEDLLKDSDPGSVGYCLQNLRNFAFYDDLAQVMARDGFDLENAWQSKDFGKIIAYIILPQGLNYGNLPKGLLKFHRYQEGTRTAIEEHMVEAAQYARDTRGIARLHFTISPEHIAPFLALLEGKQDYYSKLFNVTFDITYSVQSPSTDTIAVDHDNLPFRDDKGEVVFRPGGHGALLDNLDKLEQDIVFIKNIDNIVPDSYKSTTYDYKKAIGGLLISLKQQIDSYLDRLTDDFTEEELLSLEKFCSTDLMIRLTDDYYRLSPDKKKEQLYHILNRPMRICGMVKNQGEPGGGPFWVKGQNNGMSLQIVESSQVNLKDQSQKNIFSQSTHFNPVDLVCYIKDHKGRKFLLKSYIDKSTGFISVKSKDGRELKAQELPGLWNGAMADWISIFVEVPLITFNPVKVVNDLLRETHQ
ncbi:MAG: DUF4301 family protein [Bacteroidales bacterium]